MQQHLQSRDATEMQPAVLVWSSLFPSAAQPQAGIFIRERMFRVGRHLPITVVSPQPWFPFQGLIRLFWPHFRPETLDHEVQTGFEIHRPRYLSFPGVAKRLDGLLMAMGTYPTVRRLRKQGRVHVIDAHFAYPDGLAAARVARRLSVPLTITLRGTEVRHTRQSALRRRVIAALSSADQVFTVSESLRRLAIQLGAPAERVQTVGNGVDAAVFRPVDRMVARAEIGLPPDARILVTVGGLVERKGFHRVIDCMPGLLQSMPKLHYLVIGSAGPEGDYSDQLRSQVGSLELQDRVHFLGALSPDGVRRALSAADVFVLASRNEGWANVLLEAMACGLPVVATDVGGNAEVVCNDALGLIVPFGDQVALERALRQALGHAWQRELIRKYAEDNGWEGRIDLLVTHFKRIHGQRYHAIPARSQVG